MTYEDPGWVEPLRCLGRAMLRPWRAEGVLGASDGLSRLRAVFLAFPLALVFYFVVAVLLIEDGGPSPQTWALSTVGIAGIVGIVCTRWTASRRLVSSSDRELADSFRTNFFIGIAFAETPVLLGFALALVQDSLAPLLVGFSFTLVGFWILVPTRAHLERRQRELTATGSPLLLGEALSQAHPPTSP